MPDSLPWKMELACNNSSYPLHQLACGHHVDFDCYVQCKPNCKHINKPFEFDPVAGSVFIICEGCIIKEFIYLNADEWSEHFARVESTTEYQQADVVQQKNMKINSLGPSGWNDRYWAFRMQKESELFHGGGLISRYVPVSHFVEQMADSLGVTKIEGEEESMLDLFGSLKF